MIKGKKKVKATFKGQNGSCGFEKNKNYTLNIIVQHASGSIEIESEGGNNYCEYTSIISFLNNWDNVRSVK